MFPLFKWRGSRKCWQFFFLDIKVYKVEKPSLREKYHIHNLKEEYFSIFKYISAHLTWFKMWAFFQGKEWVWVSVQVWVVQVSLSSCCTITITIIIIILPLASSPSLSLSLLGFRRPLAAKTLAGSSGGDQSGRIISSHSVIQEFARSDWMGLWPAKII